jgi:GWxTD domain-containing protein
MHPNRSARVLPVLAVLAAAALSAPAAAGQKLAPESKEFYQTARLIMTKEEIKIWSRLPDEEARREFIADFWLKRDPDPDTEANEFKQEFEARVEYASKRFREGIKGYNTDRGRVYIFMGPPDKFEEFFPPPGSQDRGIIWWIYYDWQLGIEFADSRGDGTFKMREYTGDFFGAMDVFKLGRNVRADDVFSKKFFKFEASYDAGSREIEVRIPTKSLMFRENAEGKLQVDLRFTFYIYPDQGKGKESFQESRSVVVTDAEREDLKTVDLRFGRALAPGTSYLDVIVQGAEGMKGKIRQIFEIKVKK